MITRLLLGDVLSFARHYKEEPFHALLCDAPYELGFMNQDWDKSDISFRPETWEALGNLLYPGAFQAGWECVIGVDNEREYVDIGHARIKYWLEQGVQLPLFQGSKP